MVRDSAADLEIRRNVGESGSEKVRVRSRRLISSTVTFVFRSQPVPLFKVYSNLFIIFFGLNEEKTNCLLHQRWVASLLLLSMAFEHSRSR